MKTTCFHLGNVLKKENIDGTIRLSMWMEHSFYHVRETNFKRVDPIDYRTFRLLSDAKKAYKRHAVSMGA